MLLLLPEALPVPLLEALLLGLAPCVRELVALLLTVLLALWVLLGVLAPVPVPELLAVAVGEGVGVRGGVALPESERELEAEALAPGDKEAVALALTVELELRVLEGVACAVPLPV